MGIQTQVSAANALRLLGLKQIYTKPPKDIGRQYRTFLEELIRNYDAMMRFTDNHRELANKREPDELTEIFHNLRAGVIEERELARKQLKSLLKGSLRKINNIQSDWMRAGTMYEELENMVDEACRLICPDLYIRAGTTG